MVVNMPEKKDPHQKISPVDYDDDIIELTDEIISKPQGDEEIIDLQDNGTAVFQKPSDIPAIKDDIIDLDEVVADDENNMGEDDIIASAIVDSLDVDGDDLQEDRIRLTEESEIVFEQDDDVIMLDEEDGDPAAVSHLAEPETGKDEEIFDSEEEIVLEYESGEDEDDFFDIEDMKTIEELEIITMDDEEPDESVDEDILFDPVASLDLSPDADNEIIAMSDDPQKVPDLMAFDEEEALESKEGDDLPDLTDELEMEFTEDIGIMAEDDEQSKAEDLAAKTLEEIRELAEEDALPGIDDDMDLEFEDGEGSPGIDDLKDLEPEDEILPLDNLDDGAVEEEDDIIEITEFDEHFLEEDENQFKRADVLDASDPDEDDFLELIELEEDDSADNEEVLEFSNSDEQIREDEIDNFFSETLEDGPVLGNDEIEPAEETPALSADMAMAPALSADENGEFDFRFGSSEISDQVDRLDPFLSEDSTTEPEIASPHEEPPAENETMEDVRTAVEDTPESLPVTYDQIDAILERVIKDKFGGKIETIIYEVIEKAVSKEIERLKGALLDSTGSAVDE
jgi:hypothetical protein